MKLKENLEEAVSNIIKEFEKKQGLGFECYVSDDCIGIACFGCIYYFNVSDICHDIFTDQEKGLIIEWLENCMEVHAAGLEADINYKSYCMGLRYKKVSTPCNNETKQVKTK